MLKLEAPKQRNYSACVVRLGSFVDLPNCANVKSALIFGNSVIVGKDTEAGAVGLFFPVEAALSREFLGANNLYRKPEWGNADPEKKGYFEEHGRIKAVKFRGHKSEGFWIPIESLIYLGVSPKEFPVGAEFDTVGDHEICRKYVPVGNRVNNSTPRTAKMPKMEDRIVPNQFRFHPDTENLRRNIHKIHPDMWISLSDKWHGTSVVLANVLIKRDLTWLERLAKRLGVKVQDQEYGVTWSSRRVVKGINGESKATAIHFYSTDIWGDVAKEVSDRIPKGHTIYGEIVGYTTDGAAIQKGYHYGCQPGTHRLMVYRVTSTNADGKVIEFSWQQMKEFCAKYGFEMVKELWYGRAEEWLTSPWDKSRDTVPMLSLSKLEAAYVHDQMCAFNNLEVPAEGIVLKVDSLEEDIAFKLKNFAFLRKESEELDKGVADIETVESEVVG